MIYIINKDNKKEINNLLLNYKKIREKQNKNCKC